jgi:septum formation protein
MKKIILASKSSDRREIFSRAKIPFDSLETNIDEDYYKKIISNPIDLVKKLAQKKALKAEELLSERNEDILIISADTIVELDGEIIGKPQDEKEAFQIIRKLQNRNHQLITGIAIIDIKTSKTIIDYESTIVSFSELSDDEIQRYVETDEWRGRAGGYSIRDKASFFVESINGSNSNVIGFPMQKLFKLLKREFDINLLEN